MAARPQTAFGNAVDALLKERGWSVRKFSKMVDMPACMVSQSKRTILNPVHFDRWADVLNLSGDQRREFITQAWLAHTPRFICDLVDHLRIENATLKKRSRRR